MGLEFRQCKLQAVMGVLKSALTGPGTTSLRTGSKVFPQKSHDWLELDPFVTKICFVARKAPTQAKNKVLISLVSVPRVSHQPLQATYMLSLVSDN